MSWKKLVLVIAVFLVLGFVSWETYIGHESRIGTEKIVAAIEKSGPVGTPDKTLSYLIEMFRSETDTMIYKATVWVGFWMAILAIVMILPTLYQISEQHRSREDINASIKMLNEHGVDIDKKVQNKLLELDSAIEETRISHIMSCISNIPDPILARQKDSLSLVKSYLKMLYKESVRFENLIDRMHEDYKTGRNKRIEEEMPYIHLVIVEILTSLSKSQIVFNDANLNLEFYEVIRVAGRQFEHICSSSLDIESVKGSINVINLKFRRLIAQIGV